MLEDLCKHENADNQPIDQHRDLHRQKLEWIINVGKTWHDKLFSVEWLLLVACCSLDGGCCPLFSQFLVAAIGGIGIIKHIVLVAEIPFLGWNSEN
jgi:hypothetical protein